MYLKIAIILCMFIAGFGYSQPSEAERLLNQAGDIVFFNPVESGTIAELTLKNAPDNLIKSRSLYVSALSSYVSGRYDEALPRLYESKKIAETIDNEEYKLKSNDLINRIFKILQLADWDYPYHLKRISPEPVFKTEYLVEKGSRLLEKNKVDSAFFYANEAKAGWSESDPGYPGALYYGLTADIDFKQKAFISALANYKKAIKAADVLDNPFLSKSFYDKIADNYLALDSLQQFQENREMSKKFYSLSSMIETRASNQAHKLKIEELDNRYAENLSVFRNLMWWLLGLVLAAAALKITFYVRNRNRLKMFDQLFNYLKEQEKEKEIKKLRNDVTTVEAKEPIEAEKPEKAAKEEESSEPPHTRSSTLLKESENQLLNALEKFESSKKFIHKDMSLGRLAAQLGTNTKYLSEVINRNKGMNFNAYINKLRIDYITGKMKEEPAYLNYKVSYLAEECGYSSHSTFTTVFKSVVGVSPIMFVDFIKDEIQLEKISN